MDRGSLTNMVVEDFENYSEDFCRYTLYKVAKAIQAMHNKNVLHRDIKSDDILHSSRG